jgi:hypothetical protein
MLKAQSTPNTQCSNLNPYNQQAFERHQCH